MIFLGGKVGETQGFQAGFVDAQLGSGQKPLVRKFIQGSENV